MKKGRKETEKENKNEGVKREGRKRMGGKKEGKKGGKRRAN